MSQEKPKASFVTFYSFKGGVGRSMALINAAGILAGRGFHVLVIDLDLEAPGLSYLNPDAPDASPTEQRARKRPLQLGFVDLLCDAKERGQEADLFALSIGDLAERYTQAYRLPPDLGEFDDGSLRIMPAGRFDGSYAQRFDALNLRELYQEGLGEPLIRAFKKKFAEGGPYDYILVDSRTGFSDEAGICTRDLADYLMILSGLNAQNVEGTCQFLRALRVATDGEKQFQIILSPVPNGEDALVDQREATAKASFEEAWGSEVDVSLQIPYHPQLSLTEEPHIFRRRRGYLFEAYRAIERGMLSALGHDARALIQGIQKALQQQDYLAALRDLRHLVRLDTGRAMLSRLGYGLREGEATLDSILSDEDGRRVVEFVVDHLLLEERYGEAQSWLYRLERDHLDLADRLHRRVVDSAPSDADALDDYAMFLENQRRDIDGAETYYRRAIEVNPTHADSLAHYGQLLVGGGRLAEGKKTLLSSFEHLDQSSVETMAEVCFSLWLVSRMQERDAERWERCFKFLITQRGFEPYPWSSERMLEQAEKALPAAELEYAKALASAYLDEDRAAHFDRCERWCALEPLDPKG